MKDRSDQCPRCGTRRVALGELTRGRTIGPGERFRFRAFGSELTWLRKGAELEPGFAACTECGLVWTEVRPNRLLSSLERFPGAELRSWLRSRDDTPI